MTTTSGASACTWSSATAPSEASPTTSRSGSDSMTRRNPMRSNAWSSTSSTVVTGGPSVDRQDDVEPPAALVAGTGLDLTAEQGSAFPHPDEPEVGPPPSPARTPPASTTSTSRVVSSRRSTSRTREFPARAAARW